MQIISSQLLLQGAPAQPIKGEQNLQARFLLQGPLPLRSRGWGCLSSGTCKPSREVNQNNLILQLHHRREHELGIKKWYPPDSQVAVIYVFSRVPSPSTCIFSALLSKGEKRSSVGKHPVKPQRLWRGSDLAPTRVALCDHEGFLVSGWQIHDSQKTLWLHYLN